MRKTSLFLAAVMALMVFAFAIPVAAADNVITFTPQGEYLYNQDFDTLTDITSDGHIATTGTLGSTQIKNGALVWTTGDGTAERGLQFYFNADKSAVSVGGDADIYCIEWDMQRNRYDRLLWVYAMCNSAASKPYKQAINSATYLKNNEQTNIKIIVDTKNKYILAFYGTNCQQIKSKYDDNTRTDLSMLYLTASGGSAYSSIDYTIDNMKMYKVSRTEFDAAYALYSLNETTMLGENTDANNVTSNLVLPQENITWTSSEPSVIATNGTVTRPLDGEGDKTVTLTATAAVKAGNGTDSASRTFTYTVTEDTWTDEQWVDKTLSELTESSLLTTAANTQGAGTISADLKVPPTEKYGCTISWVSSETMRIDAATGEVNRGTEDTAVTLTATVKKGDITKSKNLSFTVLAKSPEMFDVVEEIFTEKFSSGTIDTDRVSFFYNGIAADSAPTNYIQDGSMYLKRTDWTTTGSVTLRYYFNEDHSALSDGPYIVEFDLAKSGNKQAWVRLMNGNSEYSRDLWATSGNSFLGQTVSGNDTIHHFVYFADTAKSTYYVWVDDVLLASGKTTYTAGQKSLDSFQLSLEGGNAVAATWRLDNLKVYKTNYTDEMCVAQTVEGITVAKLLTVPENILGETYITDDLNLYTTTDNGCTITWTSDDETAINPQTGAVTRAAADKTVMLTATVSKGSKSDTKQLTFTVLKYTEDYAAVLQDSELITPNMLTTEDADKIKKSLNLPDTGAYGSTITWTSDIPNIISETGRVTRPREGEYNEPVKLTATFTKGAEALSKTFDFTVLADEAYTDPQIISDENFFGVYDKETETWTTKGKFDYNYTNATADLSKVKAAVMDGDYSLAKTELLNYIRARKQEYTMSCSRSVTTANAYAAGIVGKQTVAGEGTVSGEWGTVEIPIKTSLIDPDTALSLDLISYYDDASVVEIKSKESGAGPILRLVVNGVTKDFQATDDAYIRLGDYKNTNYGTEDRLYVKMYGSDLSNDTMRTMVRFDVSSLSNSDKITDAKLILNARATLVQDTTKRICAIRTYSAAWEEDTVLYSSVYKDYCNYNGQPDGINWNNIASADTEYQYQLPRMNWLEYLLAEYSYSGDESYAYAAIRQQMDFIKDKGSWSPTAYPGLTGGYPRTLDTSDRLKSFMRVYDGFCESDYMSPEYCTTILKHIWDMMNSAYKNHSASGNWAQAELGYLYKSAWMFPEFSASFGTDGNEANWSDFGTQASIGLMEINYFDDGVYMEPTAGYSGSSLSGFLSTYGELKNQGISITDAALNKLHQGTYYELLLKTPAGEALMYGDSGYSKKTGRSYAETDEIFNDSELEYIDSMGSTGTEPTWTSKQYPIGKYTFMRSDWSKNALYLMTQVRGYEYGSHGNADRNSVIVAAYGKTLLTDAGSFSYSAGEMRELGRSTKMHNTVTINDGTQVYNNAGSNSGDTEAIDEFGTIHTWDTDSEHDFLVQSTTATTGFDHKRTILFVKPYYWIVSDYVKAEDGTAENSYKQNWHMLPSANISIDDDNKLMRSNNSDGVDIYVLSADSDASAVREENGYYASTIGNATLNPYGYFEKKTTGDAAFNTVLVPTGNADTTASVTALDSGTESDKVTALQITTVNSGNETNGYYYMSDETNGKGTGKFGDMTTDGQMAFVHVDSANRYDMVIAKDATSITDGTKTVLSSDKTLANFTMTLTGSRMEIIADETVTMADLKIAAPDSIKTVYLNGELQSFAVVDGCVEASSGSAGGSSGTASGSWTLPGGGSSGGSGGGASGGTTVVPSNPQPTDPDNTEEPNQSGSANANGFADTSGHWAETYIEALVDKGIVNGKTETSFDPDGTVTRAEFIAMIVRMIAPEETATEAAFEDVGETDWFREAVMKAVAAGLVKEDSMFRPNDEITREETAAILERVYRLIMEEVDVAETELTFGDSDSISAWAEEAVKLMLKTGLMKGMDDGSFAPLKNSTRAEAATVIYRLCELLNQTVQD